MNVFARAPQDLTEIFTYIYTVPSGIEVLHQFLQLNTRSPIQITPYPAHIQNELSTVAETYPLGAAFVTDGYEGTIYLHLSSPLGILIPFLFHELIHSLDETLWRSARHPLPPTQKRHIVHLAECRAFHAQHLFQEKLKVLYPDFLAFHLSYRPHIPFFHRALLPHEIAELYK